MFCIDLNCDMGESYGRYTLGNDLAILDYVTSVNIACGFHAGDPGVMRATVMAAKEKGVAIGAHPGLPDLVGFGRRIMNITPHEAYEMTVYQVGALTAFCTASSVKIHHVKPHGALYNMAAGNREIAQSIAQAVRDIDPSLILYGLAGSELIKSGQDMGLETASEGFADRTYMAIGVLTPRSEKDSIIANEQAACAQAIRMIQDGLVRSQQGIDVKVQAETICIHGDGLYAVQFARHIHNALHEHGITVTTVRRKTNN